MKPILATSQFCGPCKLLKERLEEDSYEVRDMEKDREFFMENKIRSVPTLIIGERKILGFTEIMAYFEKSA